MSEHADTIRNEILRGGPHHSSIVLAALAALEAELAEARRERDEWREVLFALRAVLASGGLPYDALVAENARLKAALELIATAQNGVGGIARAALASGSEGDTA